MSSFPMAGKLGSRGAHMIPDSAVLRRPSRRVILLTKIKSTAMGAGARTMAFFRKGEELEATGYETLPYNDPTLVPPKPGFRDFDRVPRNRAPLVITAVLIATAVLGLVGWRAVLDTPAATDRGAATGR
jgi:hypothetical protein